MIFQDHLKHIFCEESVWLYRISENSEKLFRTQIKRALKLMISKNVIFIA